MSFPFQTHRMTKTGLNCRGFPETGAGVKLSPQRKQAMFTVDHLERWRKLRTSLAEMLALLPSDVHHRLQRLNKRF
jgi:hypothetical protein